MTALVAPAPDVSEDEYLSIGAACKSLLTAADAGTERIAIPWLHVIREHPVFLVQYADVARPVRNWRSVVRSSRRRIRERGGKWWQLGAAAAGDGHAWAGPQEFAAPIDALFISHLLNPGQAGLANDFYFGALPSQLAASGYRCVIALINHTRRPASEMAARWSATPVPRVVFGDSLGLTTEVALDRRLRAEAGRLRIAAAKLPAGLAQRVAARAAEEARTAAARRTLRLDAQVASLAAVLKPRAMIVTHEGHAWERIAFAAARRAVPAIMCIGYQHAAIFRRQFAIRQRLAPAFNPERIVTAGPLGCEQLKESPDLREVAITVLGSDRAGSGAPGAAAMASDREACLVIPEGLEGECSLLFEFSAECARRSPGVQFVWRLHPSVTFELLRAHNRKLRDLPANVTLSTSSLDADLQRCRWALYRGTTAIVTAVNAGLKPIYLHVRGELTIDPLYAAGPWRACVSTPSDLGRLISDERRTSDQSWQEAARQYCARFFVPFDPGVLVTALSRPADRQDGESS